jgi:hypothetical protein
MSLSAEQAIVLDDLLQRFNNLHAAIPKEFDDIKETLSKLEHRLGTTEGSVDHMVHQTGQDLKHLEESLTARLQALSAEIYDHLSTRDALKTQLPPMEPSVSLAPSKFPSSMFKIREPEPFSGKASACNAFFSQLALTYAANEERFDEDEKKILFAISHLTGTAFAYMEPYLSKLNLPSHCRPSVLINFNSFKDAIINAFGDSNPVVNAEASLRNLKQTGSASVYATEFRRLSMLVSWNDSALRSQYQLNLKDMVQDELARRESVDSLDNLITQSIDIDNRLYHRYRQRKQTTPNNQQKSSRPYHQNSASTSGTKSGNVNSSSSGAQPMDLSIMSTTKHQPLSNAQKQYRRDNNLCLYCGEKGHFNNKCPKKSSNAALNSVIASAQPNDVPSDSTLSGSVIRLATINVAASSSTSSIWIIITIMASNRPIEVRALVDSGATMSFVDPTFAEQAGLPFAEKPLRVTLADGREITSSRSSTVPMAIKGTQHQEYIELQQVPLSHYPVILGLSWLRAHNPVINWMDGTINMNCVESHYQPLEINATTQLIQQRCPTVVELDHGANFYRTVRQEKTEIFMIHPGHREEKTLVEEDSSPEPMDMETTVELPSCYQEFASVFSKSEGDKLPPHRDCDHTMPLMEGSTVPYGPIYRLSTMELETLHDYIQENLARGFIQPSESPAGAPVLFVKKKDGSLRLCVDYRGLNKITTPNRCPLPLISETLDRLNTGVIFTKLDMRGAYNLIRIAEGEEWKTAFRTRYGHFEYRVMPFGLTNAPATFQAFVNNVLREYLDHFVVVYLDDILIYSPSAAQHNAHVMSVLQKLKDAQLSLKLEKCQFGVPQVQFLGFVISKDGITMDPEKISAVVEWPTPQNPRDIQVFLGLANFYRRFIKDFSKISLPLTALLKKSATFSWNELTENAFLRLKARIISNPILCHYDPLKPCFIETDASDFALGAVCSQNDENGTPHPIAFYSRKLIPAEINYQIYDKELLAIVAAFTHWRHYLEFSQHTTIVITDHKNLEYFNTTRNLSRRQVRWSEILSDYNFIIQYRSGKANGAADALSRRDNPLEEGAAAKTTPMTLLDSKIFVNNIVGTTMEPSDQGIISGIKSLVPQDHWLGPIHEALTKNQDNEWLKDFSLVDGLVLYKGLICVPNDETIKQSILEEYHDLPAAGHFGVAKTFELVTRNFHWQGIRKYVKKYVSGCDVCHRNKSYHHKPYGMLSPLPIPDGPWQSVSVDFITQLPESNGHTAICVFVDRFSKMALFVPTTNEINAEGTAALFMEYVFAHFGLPRNLISDRGSTFTSKFFQALMKRLQVENYYSTAFHPQSDGQTERINSILEQYLRCYINHRQSNWSSYLCLAQFAYNNSKHSTTDMSPFYAILGYDPTLSIHMNPTSVFRTPADQRAQEIKETLENVKFNIALANEEHEHYYNKKVILPPKLEPGDKVWLSSKNIKTSRPTKKLDHRNLGPFSIIEAVGARSFKLDLPKTMKIHPVFHVNLLEKYTQDEIPGRIPVALPPVEVEGESEFEVEAIVDSKVVRKKLQYLIHWKGYTVMDRTWEPAANLAHSEDLISRFHQTHPDRPGSAPGARL